MLFSILLLWACQESPKTSNSIDQKTDIAHSPPPKQASKKTNSRSQMKSSVADIEDGDILITEIMHDPKKVDDYRGEWIEIYNNTPDAIDLEGLYFKSTGEVGFQIDKPILLDSQQYLVLASKKGVKANGGVQADYIYDYNRFKITEQEKISISYKDNEIDRVTYKADSPLLRPGHSLSLDPFRFEARSGGTNPHWCPSSSSYGDGDFGTPGKDNNHCSLVTELDPGDLIITEIMLHPVQTDQWKGEWIELYNTTNKIINIQNLSFTSDGDDGFIVAEKGYVLPQNYFVLGANKKSANGGAEVNITYNYNMFKLFGGDSISIYFKDTLIDSVTWAPKDWPISEGAALNLSPEGYDHQKNDNPKAWCLAEKRYGAGDLGTPGKKNLDCPNFSEALFEEEKNASCDENAIEICDGIDNDCDGLVDLSDPSMDPTSTRKWYPDLDKDGDGDAKSQFVLSCKKPADKKNRNYALNNKDCDDNDPLMNSSQADLPGDQLDSNCDGWDGSCAFGNCDWSLILADGKGLDMALIPAGKDPLKRYNISRDFYMMTTEVTQGQYENLLGKSWKQKKYAFHGLGPNRPIYHVSWYMAADFANHLTRYHNQKEQASLQECYQCQGEGFSVVCQEKMNPYECSGYRLPTEAEWEYAARSGTTAEIWTGQGSALGGTIVFETACESPATINDGASNPLLSDYAWYCKDNDNFPAAQKLPNGFGLYDMHGNQWEWIGDWDSCEYPASKKDPFCDTPGKGRGRKGGDWNDKPFNERVSPRYAKPPGDRYGSIGFRLVRGAK